MSISPQSEADSPIATLVDRRRPGRRAEVSPELIPLLRGTAAPVAEPDIEFEEPDQLQSMRGLAVGTALSLALWAGLAYAGRWLFS